MSFQKDIFGPFKRTKRTLVTLSASQPRAQGSGHWETNWGSWELSCVANRSTRGTPKLRKSSQRNQGLRTILCWWDQPSKPCRLGPSISSSDALDTERYPWIGQREAGSLTDPKETRKPANPPSWCKPELSKRILNSDLSTGPGNWWGISAPHLALSSTLNSLPTPEAWDSLQNEGVRPRCRRPKTRPLSHWKRVASYGNGTLEEVRIRGARRILANSFNSCIFKKWLLCFFSY